MKHHKKTRKFGLETNERRALLRSLALALITHGRIQTTEAKAKELRPFIEPLVTKAKQNTAGTRRYLVSKLGSGAQGLPIKKLVDTIAPKYVTRPGGYTRVIKTAIRISDGGKMAVIEFV
ncbi:MAG: large subunit ribosomal protein L17 [Parcubacteria group bacterium Gr01-1014_48]|nr:MAG: large subunit ribosomal protein L17 [Parcubacteria group bacterium Greene0416_14]TSC72232.1 MAG: large subunit ribosomal protein L17 [Parcubacteria group bacterium Gr01-1014_48]TSD01669.1 MAG: large subunit ribosomal protein L17 [Parcubacteria group bacterium Greene1014_15]TSD07813.1 MAG: large subunit ribosomal protein L17 [Parcubacteria group bacterium Greene0714_4]